MRKLYRILYEVVKVIYIFIRIAHAHSAGPVINAGTNFWESDGGQSITGGQILGLDTVGGQIFVCT